MNDLEKDAQTENRLAWGLCGLILAALLFMAWFGTGCVVQHTPPNPPATPTLAPTVAPSPTLAPYSPLPPKITMRTSGETAFGGRIDITQHYVVDLDQRVLDEIPSRADFPNFWLGCDNLGHCGSANCDSDHWTYPENAGDLAGQPTLYWWNCGGSVKYGTLPRAFDLAGPFVVSHSGGVQVTYGRTNPDGSVAPGCFRED